MGRYGVTIQELQRNMREGLRRGRNGQRRIFQKPRENQSKAFRRPEVTNIQQPKEPIDTPIRNNISGGNSNPPTFNYNIYNTAPQSTNQTKTKDFDFGLFLILISIVGVFMWAYDAGFRSMVTESGRMLIGELQPIDIAMLGLLGVLIIVLIIYLVSRKK